MQHGPTSADVLLQLRHVSKEFGGQRVLDNAELSLRPGAVHALVGQNGSGKSTLIKILAGYHHAERGGVAELDGEVVDLSHAAAARPWIRFIHQDLGLVPHLDTVDNLALGVGYASRGWIRYGAEARRAQRRLRRLGVDLDVRLPVGRLSRAEQTMVAIARALGPDDPPNTRILVLDEPTASLTRGEVDCLFEAVRAICRQGGAVLYVSHRLGEIFELADDVTVLRDGRVAITGRVGEFDEQALIEAMVGRPIATYYPEPPVAQEAAALEVMSLTGNQVSDVSFTAHVGEIIGIAGLTGSGREELPYLLVGASAWRAGSISVHGTAFVRLHPRRAIEAGLALVPSDRAARSLLPDAVVRENLTLPRLPTSGVTRWLGVRLERQETRRWLDALDVRPRDTEIPISLLSGGNQQKVVLGRWLRCSPKVLVLDEPVHGVDVGAKADILAELTTLARGGHTLVICSSDAEDLASVCDRVLVMRDGRIAADLHGAGLTRDRIVQQTLLEAAA